MINPELDYAEMRLAKLEQEELDLKAQIENAQNELKRMESKKQIAFEEAMEQFCFQIGEKANKAAPNSGIDFQSEVHYCAGSIFMERTRLHTTRAAEAPYKASREEKLAFFDENYKEIESKAVEIAKRAEQNKTAIEALLAETMERAAETVSTEGFALSLVPNKRYEEQKNWRNGEMASPWNVELSNEKAMKGQRMDVFYYWANLASGRLSAGFCLWANSSIGGPIETFRNFGGSLENIDKDAFARFVAEMIKETKTVHRV